MHITCVSISHYQVVVYGRLAYAMVFVDTKHVLTVLSRAACMVG